ncbi:60S ribosomal protein L7-1-like [Impatiens glandulifera]|uniref:60S ribosomal protein L7-1-like n=1 Tax=Impatiens glandulifera TaxID=253017 RepID=UPI001FB0E61D|nr:60S ribosomal protein L7-1-like [Impatiens glandulifera]
MGGSNPREWWIDIGATRHVCSNKELFSTFEEVRNGEKLFMGNSATSDIPGEGKVVLSYPNLRRVRYLIFKKGEGIFEKPKVPLIDNNIIEQTLGQYNMLSIKDLVHEISYVGKHFKINDFLCPFVLNKPKKTLTGKNLYKDGGDTGNHEIKNNDLIRKMN